MQLIHFCNCILWRWPR